MAVGGLPVAWQLQLCACSLHYVSTDVPEVQGACDKHAHVHTHVWRVSLIHAPMRITFTFTHVWPAAAITASHLMSPSPWATTSLASPRGPCPGSPGKVLQEVRLHTATNAGLSPASTLCEGLEHVCHTNVPPCTSHVVGVHLNVRLKVNARLELEPQSGVHLNGRL